MEGLRKSGKRGKKHPNRYNDITTAIIADTIKRKPLKNRKKPFKSYYKGIKVIIRFIIIFNTFKINPDITFRDLAKLYLPIYTIG